MATGRRLRAVTNTFRRTPEAAPEVDQLLSDPDFSTSLSALATKLGTTVDEVRTDARAALSEMSATWEERPAAAYRRFGRWILRAYDVYLDDDQIAQLRKLDGQHSLLFLFSHRSYLDGMVLPESLSARGVSPAYTFAGANLKFFPFGSLSRTGVVFIRRDTKSAPVYRLAMRSYIGQLVRNRSNLAWSIEGGRSRTGKLRPPSYGLLRYVVDAVESPQSSGGPEVVIVPVSLVYDQLHEVARMTSEARGGTKTPEDLRWMVGFARQQKQRLGRAFIDMGEPIPLRQRLAELRDDDVEGHAVERIALEVMHRINQATPVTATAVVSLSMLGHDRALDLEEVLATVQPLSRYIAKRGWPIAGGDNLDDRSTIRRTLQQLVSSGVLTCYDEGTEPVYTVGEHQHLVAAFYRNTAIHVLVQRAIAELAALGGDGGFDDEATDGDADRAVLNEALRLRELLKFEFFFPGREEFEAELTNELTLLGDDESAADTLFLAPLILRPFLEAYHVVADRLAALDGDYEQGRFLADCLRVGKQWDLQRKVANAESISTELFSTALRLAAHRNLLEAPEGTSVEDLLERRQQFATEVGAWCQRITLISQLMNGSRG